MSSEGSNGGMVPKAILVTGMHRSGTSALARIINLLGAGIGSRLLEATADNVNGYWENWHVVMFHERVLRELGMAWDSAAAIPASWTTTEPFSEYVNELCELITSEFGDQQLWMVKDPRLCRLLPLWMAALNRLGIEPNFVFEVRHPEEVIGSLIKRDNLGAGLASLLWVDYLQESFDATQGLKRTMLIYDDVLADWQACLRRVSRELAIEWPVPIEESATEVNAHLDPTMRHHRADHSNFISEVWRKDILQVFEACRSASQSPEGWSELNVRMASAKKVIESVAVIAGDLPSPSQLASKSAELVQVNHDLEQSRQVVAAREKELHELSKKLEFIRGCMDAEDAELVRVAHELGQSRSDLMDARQVVAAREKELHETKLEVRELSENLSLARSCVADLEAVVYVQKNQLLEMGVASNLAQQRNERLAAELHRTRQQLDEIIHSHSWRITRPLRLLMRLARGDFGYARTALWHWRTRRAQKPAIDTGKPARALPRLSPAELIRQLDFTSRQASALSVLVFGGGDLSATCRTLYALQRQSTEVSFDVSVLVDSISAQDHSALSVVPGLRMLGVDQVRWDSLPAQHVFVVKAGVLVSDRCFEALEDTLTRFPSGALIGPKVLDEAGHVREAGTIVWRDGSSMAFGEGWDAGRHECSYLKDVDACGDAAFVVNLNAAAKEALPEFGALGQRLSCIELAFRLREAGARVMFQPKAIVIDERPVAEGGSPATPRLPESWQPVLERDQLDAALGTRQACDRSQLKKVLLMVDHSVPQPDRDAGSRTMWQLIQMFMRHGMVVKFWPHEPNQEHRYTDLLEQEGVEVITQQDGGFNAWLLGHGAMLHSVLLSRPHVALEYLYAIRKLSAARILYYGHDIHYTRLQAQLEHQPSAELEQQMARHMAWEHAIWPAADAVYYPAEGETRLVREWLAQRGHSHAAVRTIPAYAFDTFPEAPHSNLGERRGMMFVGGFAHAPNADAAEWFVREVMPFVLAKRSDAHLYLLGSNPTPEVFALAGPNVTVVGFVDDDELARYYRNVRLSVAPLRFGAGLKGKVIEAMRFGVPCATTSVGAQGLEDLSFLAVADDPQQFANHVLDLLSDDALWQATSQASQQLVRDRYSVDAPWRVMGPDLEAKLRIK